MQKPDLTDLGRYINETLGILVSPKPLASTSQLPHFLQNTYLLFEVKILETVCILAIDQSEQEQPPAIVHKHMGQIRAKYEREVIYVRPHVTAYNRKRLIEHKVLFIVPGNQMYLPILGIDIREYFKKQRLLPVLFAPSTQVLVLYLCQNNEEELNTPVQIARHLGYSAMTLTRAFDELEGLGIGDFSSYGRERRVKFPGDKKIIWEKALPLLRSPVIKRFYIKTKDKERPGPLSGLSALAYYSMLAEPKNPVIALSSADWKKYFKRTQVSAIPFMEPDALEIEIWNYDPLLFGKNDVVDRLSLYLSLKDNHDERIESALNHMIGEMKW